MAYGREIPASGNASAKLTVPKVMSMATYFPSSSDSASYWWLSYVRSEPPVR